MQSEIGLYFLIGLTAGGLGCMALQGGILATYISRLSNEISLKQKYQVILLFLLGRIVAYGILGFFLGLIGSAFQIADWLSLTFQTLASLLMLILGVQLVVSHPLLRYFSFQPPSWVRHKFKEKMNDQGYFTPLILGSLTVLVPCGVTQGMMLLAMSMGSPFNGALVMTSFILGTTPLMAAVGFGIGFLQKKFEHWFKIISATTLILIGLYGLNGVAVVLDFPVTAQKLYSSVFGSAGDQFVAPVVNGVQEVKIVVTSNGYSPQYIKVKKGVPVKLILESVDAYSCAAAFRLPAFNVSTFLEANDTQIFNFTPSQAGKFAYACSMGMYTGTLEVVE